MQQFTRKKDNYTYFILFLLLLVASLFFCLFALRHVAIEQVDAAKEHYESVGLAYEVSRTSDNATKMLGLYVITGEQKYRDFYNEILAIRNGTAPRPIKFSQLYWDLVTEPDKRPKTSYGPPESLRSMVLKHDFSIEELAILNNAQGKIHELLHLEQKALNAMDGKFEDASGNFTLQGQPNPELAKRIIFGDEYLKVKTSVIQPVQQFYQHVVDRTQEDEDDFDRDISNIVTLAIILTILTTALMLLSLFKILNSLSKANHQNELLLHNIFPAAIANRLKNGEEQIADEFTQASILFADIINFTQLAKALGPQKTVTLLNKLFDVFDHLTDDFKVEKVKTIGDNYMVVAGIPVESTDHAKNLANYALAMLEKLRKFDETNIMNLQIRVGMASGSIIAGVIGHKKFVYDVWGNTVNLASRLEQLAKPNTILISEKMALMLEDEYIIDPQELLDVRGVGMQKTFILRGKKA